MLLHTGDTIVAIASAPGGGLRGIVRVSGPQCMQAAAALFQSASGQLLAKIRRASAIAGSMTINERGDTLPGDLYVWPGERSYTRQPTFEFHTLGSPPLLELLVQTICQHGARLAEPGEFTLRAFLAGRLDLTQAEAVLGVIDAGSRTELAVALRQLAGGLAGPLSNIRSKLLDVLAELEAGLDFVEEDIEFLSRAALRKQLQESLVETVALAERMSVRSVGGAEYRVVLYGRPNVGKSSLLNALAAEAKALVSDVAGTTRDFVTARLVFGGVPCVVVDTAGIDDTEIGGLPAQSATIDSAAQLTGREQWRDAHVRLLCLDASRQLDAWERSELGRPDDRRMLVLTKCDSIADGHIDTADAPIRRDALLTSSHTRAGLDSLRHTIENRLSAVAGLQGDVVSGTALRCRDSLDRAVECLTAACNAIDAGLGEELVAGDLRIALDELGRIAGVVCTDDILDRIFSRFCIGK